MELRGNEVEVARLSGGGWKEGVHHILNVYSVSGKHILGSAE